MIEKDAYQLKLEDPTVDDVGDDTVDKNVFAITPETEQS